MKNSKSTSRRPAQITEQTHATIKQFAALTGKTMSRALEDIVVGRAQLTPRAFDRLIPFFERGLRAGQTTSEVLEEIVLDWADTVGAAQIDDADDLSATALRGTVVHA
jgi:hypothetical protein